MSNQQASPPGKQTQVKPLQPLTDAEYEALFFQLLAGVGEGWTRGRVKAFLDTQHINQADLVVWLRSSGERLLAAPPGNEELAQRMVLLGRLDVGEVGNLAGEIGQQLERGRPSGQDNNIEDLLNQGIGLLDLELYEQAIACFDQAVAIQPDDHNAWHNRGFALGNLGRYEEAITSFDQAVAIQPDFHQAWYNRGNALFYLGRHEEAITSYDQAVAIQPDFPEAWHNRGNALGNLGRYEEALAAYDQALQFKPDFPEAWHNRGIALRNLGRDEEALASFDQALQFKPDFHKAWHNRGIALGNLGRDEEALASFDQALRFKPDFPEAWHNRGIALRNLGRDEEALASFDQALLFKPDFPEAWFSRGIALGNLGRYEEALASFDQALRFKPDDHEAWFNRGIALFYLGRDEEALASFDQALLFKPDDHQAWNNRGYVLSNLGRYEEALAAYDQALRFKPDDHQAWFNRGIVLDDLGRYEEAIASFDRAVAIKPDYHKAWHNRGIASGRSVSFNQLHSLLLGIVQSNPELNKRGYEGELASYHEGLKYCPQDTNPEGFGRLHQAIGDAHYFQGKASSYRTAYYNKAVSSYNQALKTLTEADFPQLHLDVLRDLISVQLDLGELDQVQELQRRGTDLLRRLLDGCQTPREKQRLGLKFAGFQQLTVDLAVQSGQMVQAWELAEQGKNACLSWLLTGWSDTSPSWEEIQQLLNSTTAMVYWHLSPYALHTFILTPNAEPIVKSGDNRLDDFAAWVKIWNNQYNQGKKEDQQPTSWRVDLSHRLQELAQILDISTIVDTIRNSPSPIQNLILIPHRDLHRFPIHALFPDDFTITYLPSAHMGISLKGRQQPHIPAIPNLPLLSVEHPSSTGYPPLEFAEVESAAITRMFPNHTRYPSAEATKAAVMAALPQGYGIFHFTGHGTYNFQNPTLSALMLAGDDRLTLADMENLDLTGYELVTLAACETAITGNQTITTEFVGLTSGFMWCGVSHVVSTLWNVESAPSTILMIQFYHLLQQGKGVAVALAEASRWLRDATNAQLAEWYGGEIASLSPNEEMMERFLSRRFQRLQQSSQPNHQPYNDPYFWSAFTITGIFPHEPHSSF